MRLSWPVQGQAGTAIPPGITPLASGAEEDLLLMLGSSAGSGQAQRALSQGLPPPGLLSQSLAGTLLPLLEDDFPLMPLPSEDAELLAGAAPAGAPAPSCLAAPQPEASLLSAALLPAGAGAPPLDDSPAVCYTSNHRLIRVSLKVGDAGGSARQPLLAVGARSAWLSEEPAG